MEFIEGYSISSQIVASLAVDEQIDLVKLHVVTRSSSILIFLRFVAVDMACGFSILRMSVSVIGIADKF